ncbi:MAG: class I SAM-dependent RNA methyltransferase [Bacteroidetes bacterium]|nr:class I SAM-dependent RNA methyltransferase [Bacteroidota bacterium]
MKFIAKTFHGLEEVLAEELVALGATNVEPIRRAVYFEGNHSVLYKANLYGRTILRILKPLFSFEASNEKDLYKGIYEYDWEQYISIDKTFAIDTTVKSDFFTHSKYVAYKTKDAIVDQFNKKIERRPNIDVTNPDIKINVHIFKNRVNISLDSTGESLHRRGYRDDAHVAPINEVLAAGMILLSGWDPTTTFVDPMCGSGTLLLEAAMIACNLPPARNRKHFNFMNWPDFDRDLWKKIKAESEIKSFPNYKIYGSDIMRNNMGKIDRVFSKIDFSQEIRLKRKAFEQLESPGDEGIVIMNPPYGERIQLADSIELYQMIGDQLKKNFAGFDAWIISSNLQAIKRVGLKPSKKIVLFNGALECKFVKFSLYKGSKKIKQEQIDEV